jgi:hypothetical protein
LLFKAGRLGVWAENRAQKGYFKINTFLKKKLVEPTAYSGGNIRAACQEISTFYGTRKHIAIFTKPDSSSRPESHECSPHPNFFLISILILSCFVFSSSCHTEMAWAYVFLFSRMRTTCAIRIFVDLDIITMVNKTWNYFAPQHAGPSSCLFLYSCRSTFLKLWSADHKWSSGSALVVLLDWTLVQKRQKK